MSRRRSSSVCRFFSISLLYVWNVHNYWTWGGDHRMNCSKETSWLNWKEKEKQQTSKIIRKKREATERSFKQSCEKAIVCCVLAFSPSSLVSWWWINACVRLDKDKKSVSHHIYEHPQTVSACFPPWAWFCVSTGQKEIMTTRKKNKNQQKEGGGFIKKVSSLFNLDTVMFMILFLFIVDFFNFVFPKNLLKMSIWFEFGFYSICITGLTISLV